MHLAELNAADRQDVHAALRPCLDVDRWLDAVADGRPYASVDALIAAAQTAAAPFTEDEVDRALAHHPRIGDRPAGDSVEARLSRAEQGDTDLHAETARLLREGNEAYEERFDRVFLVRAAGRSPEEILAALGARLTNAPEVEARVVADQLLEIALLRLRGLVTP